MTTITFNQKNSISGEPTVIINSITIDVDRAINSQPTKSIYVRTGIMNKTPFISQRGNGNFGAGDIVALNINEDMIIDVQFNLYERLLIWATKNNLIVK